MISKKQIAKKLTAVVLATAMVLGGILAVAPRTANAAWYKSGDAYYFRYSNGKWAKNTWVEYAGNWYYIGSDYKLATKRWVSYAGAYYYIGDKGLVVTNQWVKYGNAFYYLGSDGKLVINDFVDYLGATYYIGVNGKPLVNASVVIDGVEYFFGTDGKLADKKLIVTVAETVIFDEAGVKVTVKGLDMDAWSGPTLKLLVENNTANDIIVQTSDESINSYMCYGLMSTSVSSGKKANGTLSFMASDLEECGIENIAEIEFKLRIIDPETFNTINESKTITVKTSIAGIYQQNYDDNGTVLYSSNGIQVILKGLSDGDSWYGPGIRLEIINTSSNDYIVQTRDESVNGFMVSALFSCDVCAGKRAIDDVTFSEKELAENGSTVIKEAELTFVVLDPSSFYTVVSSESVRMTF